MGVVSNWNRRCNPHGNCQRRFSTDSVDARKVYVKIASAKWEPWRYSRDNLVELRESQLWVLEVLREDQLHSNPCTLSASSQNNRPLWMQFCKWLHQHYGHQSYLNKILLIYAAHFMCKGACSDHINHFWAWNNPQAIRKSGYQVCFTVKSGHLSQAALSLPARLAAHSHRSIQENIIEKCVSSCEAHVVVPAEQSSSAMRGRRPAVAERDLWPPRSPDLNPPYLVLRRDLK